MIAIHRYAATIGANGIWVGKMRIVIRFLVSFLLMSGSATAAMATCGTMRSTGIGLAADVQSSVDHFDAQSVIYNDSIFRADDAFSKDQDMTVIWPMVLFARDALQNAAFAAKTNLAKMNQFNQEFLAASCFQANKDDIQTEYLATIKRFDQSLQILAEIPNHWQDRYTATTCMALNNQAKNNDAKARAWADQHDPLLAQYDVARQRIAVIDQDDPAYSRRRTELIHARDKALTGVTGYPGMLSALFETTNALQQAGCLPANADSLKAYRIRHFTLLAEINAKRQEMLVAERNFPLQLKPTQIISITPDPEPIAARINPVTVPEVAPKSVLAITNNQIILRNQSRHILCVYNASSLQTRCDLKPGMLLSVNAAEITVFGGGYWSRDEGYMEMQLCRKLSRAPTEQRVLSGIEAGCTPPMP